MRALAFATFALITASAALGCSKTDVLVRDVSGTVKPPAGHTVTEVEMTDPVGGQSVTGEVDSAGNFNVSVYDYGQGVVRVLFKESGTVLGVAEFADGRGGTTTVFPVTQPPEPGKTPKNGPSGGDTPSNINYVYAETGINLGQISDAAGKGHFALTANPLAQVDTDGDGTPDLTDTDDDGDGILDSTDTDANGNDVEDNYESDDKNADGIPDELQVGAESP